MTDEVLNNTLNLILTKLDKVENTQTEMQNKLDKIEDDIIELKEESKITREAVNYTGERVDNLIETLEKSGVLAPHTV